MDRFLPVTVALALLVTTMSPPFALAAGELRLAGPLSGLETLDPATSRDLGSNAVLRQVFRGLAAFDADLVPIPELASEITVSADGISYAVALRPDAVFHDGSPIEAEDVVYSLSRAVSPTTVGAALEELGGPTFLSAIEGFDDVVAGRQSTLSGIVVVDTTHLTIRLRAPQSTFPMRLASVAASIVDREQVQADPSWSSHPNGSGPFAVERFVAGDELLLAASDRYVTGRPALDRVSYRLGASALQPFNLFQAGDIDLDTISPDDAASVGAQPDLDAQLVETPLFSLTYLAFRTDQAPLDDVHIRRALMLAFPRDKIAAVALDGDVEAATGIVPSGMLGRDWAARLPVYDLDQARAELARSRYGGAAGVPAIRVDVSGFVAAGAFQAAVESGLGIAVDIVDHDPATFFDELARGSYAAHELTWGADYPDPSTFLVSLFGSGSADNATGYANAEVDRLLAEAEATVDVDVRAGLYAEAQQLVVDDAVVIPLFNDVQRTLVCDGVTGVNVTPMGILRLETISVGD